MLMIASSISCQIVWTEFGLILLHYVGQSLKVTVILIDSSMNGFQVCTIVNGHCNFAHQMLRSARSACAEAFWASAFYSENVHLNVCSGSVLGVKLVF